MHHLIRKQLLNFTWDGDDLDDAAEFWLRLYETAANVHGSSPRPAHAIEILLRGFPRQEAEALRGQLLSRLTDSQSDFPAPRVDQPDAGAISVSCALLPGNESPPAGLGVPRLAGPPFDGLYVEVRIRASSNEGIATRRPKVHATLVLVGELRGGRLQLKGMWRTGMAGWEDQIARCSAWNEQDQWLQALDRFCDTGEIPAKLAAKLFLTRGADKFNRAFMSLIHVPLGKPRLKGVALRASAYAILLTALALGAWRLVAGGPGISWGPLVLAALFVVFPAWFFVKAEFRYLFTGRRQFLERYGILATTTVQVIPYMPMESDDRLGNPWVREYTAELQAAGYRFVGDSRLEPEVNGASVIRTFYAPDGVTYLAVLFMTSTGPDPATAFQMWPAAIACFAHTFFTDGAWASSINGLSGGFRKKRTGPKHAMRVFVEAKEPLEFAELHMASARRFAEATGRTPLPQQSFHEYLERQNVLQEEEHQRFADYPYAWGDHWHWYVQTPRREYLVDNG